MLISPININLKINNPYIVSNKHYSSDNRRISGVYPSDCVTFSSKINGTNAKKVILLIGAPNSGKGTTARALSEHLSLPYIGSGDILRKEMKRRNWFSEVTKQFMDSMGMMPKRKQLIDLFVCNQLEEKLRLPEYKNGFILEGFPRNIEEADMLKKIFDSEGNIDLKIVHLDVNISILYERCAHRFICDDCGKSFSIENIEKLPHCDCGGKLIKRDDDNPKTLLRRLKKYRTDTLPLIKYYGDKVSRVHVKSLKTTSNEVVEKIISKISE